MSSLGTTQDAAASRTSWPRKRAASIAERWVRHQYGVPLSNALQVPVVMALQLLAAIAKTVAEALDQVLLVPTTAAAAQMIALTGLLQRSAAGAQQTG